MAMGTRKGREKQEDLWIAHTELASAPGHPFYQRLNELLESESFDEFVENRCAKFYAAKYGRPSLTPGIYFRSLLIGYFEGIEAERGIAWRLADSLALRHFVGIALDDFTHASSARSGDTSGSCQLGVMHARGSRPAEGQAHRHWRDDAGSQRRDA